MTRRKGDTNGDGATSRKLLNRPLIALIALVFAVVSPALVMAYSYGGLNADVMRIDARVDAVEERIEKQLDRIYERLDQLFELSRSSRWNR